MDSNQPLISVLMGTYYRSTDTVALRRSVSSILAQSYQKLEFLICDDGSLAEAARYLDEAASVDQRIVLVRPGSACLLPQKLNFCLQAAKGQFIARMDDDDFAYPQRLKKQVEYLDLHEEISFVGCNVNLYRGNTHVGMWRFPERPVVKDFFIRQPFIHPTLLFRRSALETVGGYSEDKRCILCEDYDLLLRLYTAGLQGANLQETLFDYSLPLTAKGHRRMIHRWNETVTRWRRFKALGVLPGALPFVLKPLAAGMIPERILQKIKHTTDSCEEK